MSKKKHNEDERYNFRMKGQRERIKKARRKWQSESDWLREAVAEKLTRTNAEKAAAPKKAATPKKKPTPKKPRQPK